MTAAFRELFSSKSASDRLTALTETRDEFGDRIEVARDALASSIAKTGDVESEEAMAASHLIENLEQGLTSVCAALRKLEAEARQEAQAVQSAEQEKADKAAKKALTALGKAAADFDIAVGKLDIAHRTFERAHQEATVAVNASGGKLAAAHLPQRFVAALFAGAPTLYRTITQRLRTGQPLSGGQRVKLADSFKG